MRKNAGLLPAGRQVGFGEFGLDHAANARKIIVIGGQRPNHVQMVWQQHDRINGEWPLGPNGFDRLAQTLPSEFLIEQILRRWCVTSVKNTIAPSK